MYVLFLSFLFEDLIYAPRMVETRKKVQNNIMSGY